MKLAEQNTPTFGATVRNNKALRTLIRDAQTLYGKQYIRLAKSQLEKLGSSKDIVTFTNPTWEYQKRLDGKLYKERVTYALFNGRYIGNFENRFFSNFLSTAKKRIKILDPKRPKLIYTQAQPKEPIKYHPPKKQSFIRKFINKVFK